MYGVVELPETDETKKSYCQNSFPDLTRERVDLLKKDEQHFVHFTTVTVDIYMKELYTGNRMFGCVL